MPIVENILVSFYMKAVENEQASQKEGRPIYIDREYIELQPVGDNKTMIARPVQEKDKIKYPDLYDAFVNNKPVELEGTILAAWPVMTPALIKNLEHYEVYTVEHVAGLDDGACQRIGMGTTQLRDQAKVYIASAEGTALENQLAAEKQRAEERAAALEAELAELGETFRQFKAEMLEKGQLDAATVAAQEAATAPKPADESGGTTAAPKRRGRRPKRSAPQAA